MKRLFAILDASGKFDAPPGELSIAFLDGPAMSRLHLDFLDDSSVTDVITFDGAPELGTAGEICVCAHVARNYAQAHGTDFAEELTLYLVHGYLHLSGFDDTTPDARKKMRQGESRAMSLLRDAGAIPNLRLV